MKRLILAVGFVLLAGLALAQTLPELFGKLKEQIKAGSWADAVKTLDALDAESGKPGNEAARKQLEGPLAFYRGVCDSNLGKDDKAVEDFSAYLKLQPNAEIDKTMYSKKAVAAFEKAQKQATERAPSLAEAYKEFVPPEESRQRDPSDPLWGDGPVRWIMTDGEKEMWKTLPDGNARIAFVETFWGARDPAFRREFDRRVAFADANLAQDTEQIGSLSDRGMVFILMGPPTYAGRKPLRTGEDANENAGMSTVGSQDEHIAEQTSKPTPDKRNVSSAKLATQSVKYGSPGRNAASASNNSLEVWHYRRELLPTSIPYHQVDFEFVTRQGYGVNTLQRNTESVNTLDAAKTAARTTTMSKP
jgi:GWxTD domain-containing protein